MLNNIKLNNTIENKYNKYNKYNKNNKKRCFFYFVFGFF